MKNTIKKILYKTGTIDTARSAYNSIKTLSLRNLLDELSYKGGVLPDGYPAPPRDLIFLIIGLRWKSEYYNSGKKLYHQMESIFINKGISLNGLENILDFGCGCGRIIRHIHFNNSAASLYGSDYNPDLIKWCSKNLPFGQFSVNQIAPPLEYQDSLFNLVYARSVFTHLTGTLQLNWMDEFRRILKPGGFLYLTTHGRSTFKNLSGAENKILEEKGILTLNQSIEGDNKCSTYQTKFYVENNFLNGFELFEFIPGENDSFSKQDIYILKKL